MSISLSMTANPLPSAVGPNRGSGHGNPAPNSALNLVHGLESLTRLPGLMSLEHDPVSVSQHQAEHDPPTGRAEQHLSGRGPELRDAKPAYKLIDLPGLTCAKHELFHRAASVKTLYRHLRRDRICVHSPRLKGASAEGGR